MCKKATLEEIKQIPKEMLSCEDVAPYFGCDPQDIRVQAKQNASALGVPCIIGANGIERVIEASLTAYEANALRKSASLLQQTLADLDRKTSEKR